MASSYSCRRRSLPFEAEAIVLEVSGPVPDPAGLLSQQVHGPSGPLGGAAGRVVYEDLVSEAATIGATVANSGMWSWSAKCLEIRVSARLATANWWAHDLRLFQTT